MKSGQDLCANYLLLVICALQLHKSNQSSINSICSSGWKYKKQDVDRMSSSRNWKKKTLLESSQGQVFRTNNGETWILFALFQLSGETKLPLHFLYRDLGLFVSPWLQNIAMLQ